ncbi:MAG: Fic/DOC family protein [Tenericutes bacterium ADurb.Bin087]|nr:MAG: Fic/DOC family protein [Tenericutes bacterium ADurb.Bin087]
MSKINEIQVLLSKKAELNARLSLLPYDGTPEIKTISGKDYLYIRKRVLNKVTSTYVDVYSDKLYNVLLRNNAEAKKLRREMRKIEKNLAALGYKEGTLRPNVILARDFARKNRNAIIYDQVILEGIGTTFPEIEAILEQGIIRNAKVEDVQKILNLKRAWEFILDDNVLLAKTDFNLISYIAKIVNEGFYINGGEVRGVPIKIGGSTYYPPIPLATKVKENIISLLSAPLNEIDIAIELCLYIMKTQIFNDGNKRTAVIACNHYLVSKGIGFLAIAHDNVSKFKEMLVNYYENKHPNVIKDYLKTCIHKLLPNIK